MTEFGLEVRRTADFVRMAGGTVMPPAGLLARPELLLPVLVVPVLLLLVLAMQLVRLRWQDELYGAGSSARWELLVEGALSAGQRGVCGAAVRRSPDATRLSPSAPLNPPASIAASA